MLYAQRLELQDAQHGYVESRREQVRLQEELSLKEKAFRDTQMHEMGEMKRAQEQRVDEVSVQKKKEMQEQMNSMNDSGEFSRSGIKLQWEIVLRFQSTCNDSKFSFHTEPRQTLAS